jgi:hypothetical protein
VACYGVEFEEYTDLEFEEYTGTRWDCELHGIDLENTASTAGEKTWCYSRPDRHAECTTWAGRGECAHRTSAHN